MSFSDNIFWRIFWFSRRRRFFTLLRLFPGCCPSNASRDGSKLCRRPGGGGGMSGVGTESHRVVDFGTCFGITWCEWYGSNAQLQTVSFGGDVSLRAAILAQRRGNPNPTASLVGRLERQNGASSVFSMKRFIFLFGLFRAEGKPAVDGLVQKALEQCEDGKGNGLFQTLHQKHLRQSQQVIEREDPLKKRIYLVGTCHKVGSDLLRNTMRWIFDSLGATDSCNYGDSGGFITSKVTRGPNGRPWDCAIHPQNLRFNEVFSAAPILELRQQKQAFRGVMSIRDPFEMIVSAYCCFGL